ncbi:ROK family protein, partial [Streptomyces sp. ZG43]
VRGVQVGAPGQFLGGAGEGERGPLVAGDDLGGDAEEVTYALGDLGTVLCTAPLNEIRIAVIGGGVAAAGEVLFAPLRQALDQYATLAFVRGLTVVPAQTGTDAGLIGAAAAVLRADGRGGSQAGRRQAA